MNFFSLKSIPCIIHIYIIRNRCGSSLLFVTFNKGYYNSFDLVIDEQQNQATYQINHREIDEEVR